MRDVVLRLVVKHYERAREVAKDVAERTQRTLQTAKDVSRELRESAEQARRSSEQRKAAGPSSGAGGGAGAGHDGAAANRRDVGQVFGRLNDVRERGEALARIASGQQSAGQTVASLLGMTGRLVQGAAPFMALMAPITEKLMAYVDEQIARELEKRTSEIVAQLEAERLRSDYTRRLREDPGFQREQARRAFELTVADEARLGRRVEPTSADLVADFGL